MNRISKKIIRLAIPLTAMVVCLAATAAAEVWQQNISMLVQTDGKPDGSASVFDSADFQQLLLQMEGRPISFVLSLGDGAVYSLPADSVRTDRDGNAVFGIFKTDYVSELEKKDAVLAFTWDKHAIQVQPLPPLVGAASLQKILDMKPAYAHAAQVYKPDATKIAALKAVSVDTEIRVYFGTWCLLCKQVVPSLIRSVEVAGNPKIKVTYTGVDEDLLQPETEIARDHITKTPTILVLRNGVEMGRIEEKPATTVEGDIAAILATTR